jgi:hypothetical protein
VEEGGGEENREIDFCLFPAIPALFFFVVVVVAAFMHAWP